MCILPVPAYPEKIQISDFLKNKFKFRMLDLTHYFLIIITSFSYSNCENKTLQNTVSPKL